MGAEDDFAQGVEIIPGLYYFVTVKRPDSPRYSSIAQSNICYCIDDELLYEPFFADFGPLNLGRTYRFCQKTKQLLQEAERLGKRVYLYTGPHAHQKANAAVLVGIYQVIYLNRTADAAFKPLSIYKPYVPFRDASCGVSTFHLTVYDVIRGIQRARDVGFIDWNSGSSTWSLEEYEYYEQVENGDLNWIVPGKFVAFSGPAARCNEVAGYRLHTPEDYWDYFRRRGVTTIVRLNKKVYDRKRFLDGGFKHHEMYFPDGSCPTDAIIQRFLDTVETEPGAVAVHCKAGLGRTGVLICLYIMKHYRFSAEEVIGYIRVCRPGSVIGPQQNFIREMEARMWHEGELYRAARGLPKVAAPVSDLLVAGRAAGQAADAASASPAPSTTNGSNGNGYLNGSSYGPRSSTSSGRAGSAGNSAAAPAGASGAGNGGLLTSAAGAAAAAAAAAATTAADMSLLQYSKLQSYGSAASQMPYSGVGAYYAAASDYNAAAAGGAASSLVSGGVGSGVSPSNGYVSTAGIAASYSTGSVPTVSSFRSRYSGSNASYSNVSTAANSSAIGRSMTPLRYGQQTNSAYGSGAHYGAYHHHHHHSVSSSIQGPLQSSSAGVRGSLAMGPVSRSMPVAPAGLVGGSAGGAAPGGGAGRSPSTGRLSAAAGLAAPPSASVSALRSTLHTDTLSAAERPKYIPERNTQSADVGAGFGLGATSAPGGGGGGGSVNASAPWRIAVPSASAGSSGPGTPSAGSGGAAGASASGGGAGGLTRAPSLGSGSRGASATGHPGTPSGPGSTSGGVARILAPNGQPRKVPVALLNQYSQQAAAVAPGWSGGGGGGKQAPGSAAGQLRGGYSYGMRQGWTHGHSLPAGRPVAASQPTYEPLRDQCGPSLFVCVGHGTGLQPSQQSYQQTYQQAVQALRNRQCGGVRGRAAGNAKTAYGAVRSEPGTAPGGAAGVAASHSSASGVRAAGGVVVRVVAGRAHVVKSVG